MCSLGKPKGCAAFIGYLKNLWRKQSSEDDCFFPYNPYWMEPIISSNTFSFDSFAVKLQNTSSWCVQAVKVQQTLDMFTCMHSGWCLSHFQLSPSYKQPDPTFPHCFAPMAHRAAFTPGEGPELPAGLPWKKNTKTFSWGSLSNQFGWQHWLWVVRDHTGPAVMLSISTAAATRVYFSGRKLGFPGHQIHSA